MSLEKIRHDVEEWKYALTSKRAKVLLDEIDRHTPEVSPALRTAGDDLTAFFAQVQSIAIDVGVGHGNLLGGTTVRLHFRRR